MRTPPANMPSSFLAVATAVFAVSKLAYAGKAIVRNQCGHDVYLWHISSSRTDSSPTILSAGSGSYSEEFVSCPTGGVSLKLSNSTDMTAITQYEYTLDSTMVFYDLSNVNCVGTNCPFQRGGMSLTPSADCAKINCPAGDLVCKAAYTLWNDNWASHGCTKSTDLTMILCPGGSSSDDGFISSGLSPDQTGTTSGGVEIAAYSTSSTTNTSTYHTPAAYPPANKPPANKPPANKPPANKPPANKPPANKPPANKPPTEEQPTLTTLSTHKKMRPTGAAPTTSTTGTVPPPEITPPPGTGRKGSHTHWVTEMAYLTVHSTVFVTVDDATGQPDTNYGYGFRRKLKARHAVPHKHARRHPHG